MATKTEIYESWKKRASKIEEDCNYCKNERYITEIPFNFGCDRAGNIRLNLHACPVCNWEGLSEKLNKVGVEFTSMLREFAKMYAEEKACYFVGCKPTNDKLFKTPIELKYNK
jgi:hypothetical protein